MAYRWVPDAGLNEEFEDQHQAEDWLSSFYDDLLDAGVTQVSLYEDDRLIYGPMGLEKS